MRDRQPDTDRERCSFNKASYVAYRGPWAAETFVSERATIERLGLLAK